MSLSWSGVSLLFSVVWVSAIGATAIAQVPDTVPTDSLENTCKAALFDVQQRILGYRSAYVTDVSLLDIDTDAALPTATPLTVFLGLDSYDAIGAGDVVTQSAALNLLASEQLLLGFSDRIIRNCEDIVSVTFLLTEYQQRTFGWVDGTVQPFACGQPPLAWGEQFCFTDF